MLSLIPTANPTRTMSRRQWLQIGSLAPAGLAGAGWMGSALAAASTAAARPATAKNCIAIFLCGGPSQPDLWDMKPAAPTGICSEFSPLQTNVPGIYFSELIPSLTPHADKLALIRSMTHGDNDHNKAIVHALMGQKSPRPGEVFVARHDHPAVGAILHNVLGSDGEMPPWVVLPRPFTTNSPPHKGQSAGFLGERFDPLIFDKPKQGSLTDAPLTLEAIRPGEGLGVDRFVDRRSLLQALDDGSPTHPTSPTLQENYRKAFTLLTSAETKRAFDLDQEPASVRDRYGRNEYGQSFLMARRMIEAGVRFVNVFWTFFDTKGCQFNLWDNHGVPNDVCGIDGQLTGRQQLTHDYCTPSFDRCFPALLEDLEDRGLLDETLVVVGGEFGRTPHINKTAGRDHWAHCYTQLLAGGGIRGGQVYGASDATGAFVKDNPVTPDDLHATILHAFGVTPADVVHEPTGRPVHVTTGTPVTALF